MTRTMVCLDGSRLSERALPYALAWDPGAEILLATVPEGEESLLECLARELREQGYQASWRTPRGAPHEALLELAAAEQVDLMVLTSHGRTGLQRLLLGSSPSGSSGTAPRRFYSFRPEPRTCPRFTRCALRLLQGASCTSRSAWRRAGTWTSPIW